MLIDRLYDWLAVAPAPEADRILTDALAAAEAAFAERIVALLLRRGGDAAWAGLIAHAERLTPAQRQALHSPTEQLSHGAAQALRFPTVDARLNALAVIGEARSPHLAYLLGDALQDSSPRVREAAARVLVETATAFLAAPRPTAQEPAERRAAHREQRKLVARAVRDALASFATHLRVEVVEVALWFVRDLGRPFWDELDQPRSRIAPVVSDHLPRWNRPFMAAFLLLALRERRWRPLALQRLASWRSPQEAAALLDESDLLDQEDIRSHLAAIRNPGWFGRLETGLADLPAELRASVPRWLCCVGYADATRVELLARQLAADDAALRRAAVHALATLDRPEALEHMRGVARGASPLRTFARWFVAGREALLERQRAAQPPDPARPASDEDATYDMEFSRLWLECRRTPAEQRGPLIQRLRDNAERWRARLIGCLESPDARDRALVLTVASDAALAPRFAQHVRGLLNDPTESVRELAHAIFALSESGEASAAPALEPSAAAGEAGSTLG